MANKSTNIILAILCVLTAGSVALGGISIYQIRDTRKFVENMSGEGEDIDQEDGVIIAGEYEIKPTTEISDAYKSGDTSHLSDRDKETLDMAKEVIDEYIKDDMSDYEKEQAIYEYLTTKMQNSTGILTVVSTGSGEYDNPHDVLKNHSAVCVGYATTFRMFMQMFDIECKVIHSSDRIHSWDLVHLDDGWYHTDCYMDANVGSSTPSYASFNMNDSYAEQSHTWTHDFFPAAEGVKYNYMLANCEEIKDIYAIPEWFFRHWNDKDGMMSCRFKTEISGEEDEQIAATIADRLDSMGQQEDTYTTHSWMKDADENYVLCFRVERYNEDESADYDLDEKTLNKIEKAIEKAMKKYDVELEGYSDEDYETYEDEVMYDDTDVNPEMGMEG